MFSVEKVDASFIELSAKRFHNGQGLTIKYGLKPLFLLLYIEEIEKGF